MVCRERAKMLRHQQRVPNDRAPMPGRGAHPRGPSRAAVRCCRNFAMTQLSLGQHTWLRAASSHHTRTTQAGFEQKKYAAVSDLAGRQQASSRFRAIFPSISDCTELIDKAGCGDCFMGAGDGSAAKRCCDESVRGSCALGLFMLWPLFGYFRSLINNAGFY